MRDKKPVILYGSAHCVPCATAKQWLKENKVSYQYFDVEMMTSEEIDSLGVQSLPTLIVGDSIISGFTKTEYQLLLMD